MDNRWSEDMQIQIQVEPEIEARLARAAAIRHMGLTQFVTQSALREADAVIEQAEALRVSHRDFTRILDLLENSPIPNIRLKNAIASLPETL